MIGYHLPARACPAPEGQRPHFCLLLISYGTRRQSWQLLNFYGPNTVAMSDWGPYNPENFSTLPDNDLYVHPETRMQFCLALCGVKAAYEALQKEGHFFAMSVSMRRIFTMMPMRYPYYNIGNSVTLAPAASISQTGFGSHFASQAGVSRNQGSSTKSAHSKSDRSRSTGPSVLHTRTNSVAQRAHSVNVRVHSPELGEPLNDSSTDLSASDVSISFPAKNMQKNRKRPPRAVMKVAKPAKVMSTKPKKRHGRAPGSSIFAPQPLLDIGRDFPDAVQLQETINQTCDNWQGAFKMALHTLFSNTELTKSTATQVDRKRLQVATALVRKFCQLKNQSGPTIQQCHTGFFLAQKSAKQGPC